MAGYGRHEVQMDWKKSIQSDKEFNWAKLAYVFYTFLGVHFAGQERVTHPYCLRGILT